MILACQLADQPDGLPQMAELLGHWEPTVGEETPDLRGWEWHYLQGLTNRQVLVTKPSLRQPAMPLWSPDGNQLYIAHARGKDGELWDLHERKQVGTFPGKRLSHHRISSGGRLQVLSEDLIEYEVNVHVGVLEKPQDYGLNAAEPCWRAAWDPRHRFLAVIHPFQERYLKIWDDRKREWSDELAEDVSVVSWSANGQFLALVSGSRDVQLWGTKSRRVSLPVAYFDGCQALSWHPTEPILAIGHDANISLYSTTDGKVTGPLRATTDMVTSLSWNPQGQSLAAGRSEHTIWLWEPERERVMGKLGGHEGEVEYLDWHHTSRYLASGDGNGVTCVWDIQKELNRFRYVEGQGGKFASWSPDGKQLVAGMISPNNLASIWDLETGAVSEFYHVPGWLVGLEWHRETNTILVGQARNKPSSMREMNTPTPHQLESFKYNSQQQDHYSMIRWNRDGRWLALPSFAKIELIQNPKDERLLLKGHDDRTFDVRWNPQGTLLASGSLDGTVRLWSPVQGGQIEQVDCEVPVEAIAWSPDGSALAIADHFNRIRVRRIESKTWDQRVLVGHSRLIQSLDWSPDGKRLASASEDHTIRLWDMEVSALVGVMKQHEKGVVVIYQQQLPT